MHTETSLLNCPFCTQVDNNESLYPSNNGEMSLEELSVARTVLLCPGAFLHLGSVKAVSWVLRKVPVEALVSILVRMSTPTLARPHFVGTYLRNLGKSSVGVFYKCPPASMSAEALQYYQILPDHYVHIFGSTVKVPAGIKYPEEWIMRIQQESPFLQHRTGDHGRAVAVRQDRAGQRMKSLLLQGADSQRPVLDMFADQSYLEMQQDSSFLQQADDKRHVLEAILGVESHLQQMQNDSPFLQRPDDKSGILETIPDDIHLQLQQDPTFLPRDDDKRVLESITDEEHLQRDSPFLPRTDDQGLVLEVIDQKDQDNLPMEIHQI